jgi:hypothetical protein
LQAIAEAFALLCTRLGLDEPLLLHAPGVQLVAEGVDDLSRAVISGENAICSNMALRTLVEEQAALLGWKVSVDLFATASNSLSPRFYSRFAEPDAEAVDAMAQPDWGSSLCPRCGRRHREVAFAFPPRILLHMVIRKAVADRVKGIFVVPFSITQSFWGRMVEASRTVGGDRHGCIRLRNPSQFVTRALEYGSRRIAVFALDFGGGEEAECAPPCGQEAEHRPRGSLESSVDAADRVRIRSSLHRQLASLHADRSPPPRS